MMSVSELESPVKTETIEPQETPSLKSSTPTEQLVLGAVFGVVFGFLLQKGGVAKYHILMGMLLLEDFTVAKVMLTAIVVGCIGVFTLQRMGLVEFHLKPTRYAANIVGGLIFGFGFALMGYCPGTGAAALGQGNWDAIAGVFGLILGSYLYAEASANLGQSIEKWGDMGKLTLPELVGMKTTTFLIFFIPVLVAVLVVLNQLSPS